MLSSLEWTVRGEPRHHTDHKALPEGSRHSHAAGPSSPSLQTEGTSYSLLSDPVRSTHDRSHTSSLRTRLGLYNRHFDGTERRLQFQLSGS